MEESKNRRPMIEESLKELDKVLSELSEEANKLKQKIFQEDLQDTTTIAIIESIRIKINVI